MAVQSKKEPDSFLTKSWKCPQSGQRCQRSEMPEVCLALPWPEDGDTRKAVWSPLSLFPEE